MMKILVTGSAGFIGFHTVNKLLEKGFSVLGVDNINDYYDPSLKKNRLNFLEKKANTLKSDYDFIEGDIGSESFVKDFFQSYSISSVIHLAAQAGVSYSLTNPKAYIHSNINGFFNVIEASRTNDIRHFVYASTSSVYGANRKVPFSEHHSADHPLQLYAATKRSNELMAHSYSYLFNLPTTGLRFFTVYGPWGRPDMSLFLFTKAIIEGKPIQLFNKGHHSRDFTYVDDIVEGIIKTLEVIPEINPLWDKNHPDPPTSQAPFRILNIGNNKPINLTDYIEIIEKTLNKKAIKEFLPPRKEDVLETFADITELKALTGYTPKTPIEEGIKKFVHWYKDYYKV